ncbi:MAG: cellulase family glycosylhydrolase [Ignavibacteriae bacterium]|nr:cellulase family glycosylhydrolase [Ignavibacteriota bacterium]
MKYNRREFIKSTSTLALATVAYSFPLFTDEKQESKKKLRVAVFFDEGFPVEDGMSITKEFLRDALKDSHVEFLNLNELKERLNVQSFDVLVLPYGSAFPKQAWGAIIKYLKAGGNWVNLGGIPFDLPVVKEGDGWRKEVRQTAYHKKIGITQAFPVATGGLHLAGGVHLTTVEEVYELYVRFTETKDFPNEDGPAGARDANLKALAYGYSEDKKKVAAPIVEIDRMMGDYAGGRWVLVNFKGIIEKVVIQVLVERAACGAMDLTARCSFACYHEGEIPSFTIQLRNPKGVMERWSNGVSESWSDGGCSVEILNERGKLIEKQAVQLQGNGELLTGYLTSKRTSFAPGFYQVQVKQKIRFPHLEWAEFLSYTTGFWVYDKKLMERGKPFTTNESYLLRDGKPYPVTGTSYMGSDVHRKFLFEPNVFVWENDFAEMKEANINMVRTGIWTAWKNYMLDVGAPTEGVLRAVDAFLLTAKKHDIPVIFTFFAFLPEMWGGENPYLDPRSVNAQKEFIAAFTHRYRTVNDIIWDFINEPSFSNPNQLWLTRPNGDRFEVEAWNKWLKEKYQTTSDEELTTKLQEVYRCTADEAITLPSLDDFADMNIFNERRPMKVVDYRLFAQEMFNNWVKEMTKAIRSNGNPNQLITVGQDEGGTFERPSPQFYAGVVDFTCLHNWWYNDDLLWDSIMTKAPGKPNLVEETGVMFYEKPGGSAWRTEQEVANLLERKLAFSLGANGAGFIEWVWNTNPYMKSDNEAAIGAHRVDGTAKPELEPILKYSKFFAENGHLMNGRIDEDVVMMIPHSQMFSTRNFATEATQKCVRAMCYHCRVPMRAVSEYNIDLLKQPPKLFVVPSPRILNQQAWASLLKFAEAGSTVLITGVFDSDEHCLPVERTKQLGLSATVQPIMQEEFLNIDGNEIQLSFRGNKIQRLEKAVLRSSKDGLHLAGGVHLIPRGKGNIIWSPLPVELSEQIQATVVLYSLALKQANVERTFSLEEEALGVLILPTIFKDSVMYTFVSETDRDTKINFKHIEAKTSIHVIVPAQRTSVLFMSREDGRIISTL